MRAELIRKVMFPFGLAVVSIAGGAWSAAGHHAAAFVAPSSLVFEDVADAAGVGHLGRSWGMAWGDLDGDGHLDVYVSNHMAPSSLFVNQGDGTFVEWTDTVIERVPGDVHGSAWADFDGDGDQDLLAITGATPDLAKDDNRLFVNDAGSLSLVAGSGGVSAHLARGRNPLWFDADGDGLIDVLETAAARTDGLADPAILFRQHGPGLFTPTELSVGAALSESSLFAQLADLDGDRRMELVVHGEEYPQRVFAIGEIPLVEKDVGLPRYAGDDATDVVLADLNNDTLTDVLVVGHDDRSNFGIADSDLRLSLLVSATEHGVEFDTSGDLEIELSGGWPGRGATLAPNDIYIGASGWHPPSTTFSLTGADDVDGIAPHVPGVDGGVYLGRDPGTGTWSVSCSDPATCTMDGIISSSEAITGLEAVGFDVTGSPDRPRLWLQEQDGGFSESTDGAGLGGAVDCVSVTAGDFDADMDLDLYLACSNRAVNTENLLFENRGDGTFDKVLGAGGASSAVTGKADSVTAADFDNDGDLDLMVTNGRGPDPLAADGPTQLFRNQGSGGHWLMMDLQGTTSNPDGIGAVVLVEAGGLVQARTADAMHSRAQNDPRLHFGLGPNEVADRVTIHWPSGIVQTLGPVGADQVLVVSEELPHLESGIVAVDSRWRTVQLDDPFGRPVVVAGPVGSLDEEGVTVRIRNVGPDSFDIRLEEWPYLADRSHPAEEVAYLVVEEGTHAYGDGTVFAAGRVEADRSTAHVEFAAPFLELPALVPSVTTRIGFRPVAARIVSLRETGFGVRLQEQESSVYRHPAETVSWIAWSPGAVAGPLAHHVLTATLSDQPALVEFTGMPNRACVLGAPNSFVERDPVVLRHVSVGLDHVELYLDEEQSLDDETSHAPESVGLIIVDCPSP